MEASAPDLALAHGFPMSVISVVEDSFCVPNPIEMIVKKKYDGFFLNQRYEVQDVNGNLLLQVDGSSLSMQKKRVMRDAAGSPILTMREKVNCSLNFLRLCHSDKCENLQTPSFKFFWSKLKIKRKKWNKVIFLLV